MIQFSDSDIGAHYKKKVAQGQYVVSDTRCPALHDCKLEWEAGQRSRRGRSPVEYRGLSFVRSSVRLSICLPPQALSSLKSALSGLKSAVSGLKSALSGLESEMADFRPKRTGFRSEGQI